MRKVEVDKEMGLKSVKEYPPAPLSKPAEGAGGKTGLWRTYRPVVDLNKCTGCRICWAYCPDRAIKLRDDGKVEVDYVWCKGCLICFHECPVKAIDKVVEEFGE